MQSTSQDPYYQTNGSGLMEQVGGKRSRSQPQFDEEYNNEEQVNGGYHQNGYHGENQDQDDYEDQQDSFQEDQSFQEEAQDSFQQEPHPHFNATSSKPTKRSRPPTIFGGSKRKKSKGKAKANAVLNSSLAHAGAGQETQPSDGKKKPGLESLQRPLLGLDVPRLNDEGESSEGQEKEESRLWLKDDDKRKLQVVISSIDPLLLSEPLPSLIPSDEDESLDQSEALTLEKALQTGAGEKGIELKELVLRLHALRQPLLTSSSLAEAEENEDENNSLEGANQQDVKNETPSKPAMKDFKTLEAERTRLSNLTLLSSLLEDLATQYRDEQARLTGSSSSFLRNGIEASDDATEVKDEDHEMAVLLGLEEPKKKNLIQAIRKKDQRLRKFALHMRLPDGDYFTNAVEMTDEMIEELDTGNADLIEVLPEPHTSQSHEVPTLGSRLSLRASLLPPRSTSAQIKEREHDVLVPTKPTSFGQFSSFLPSYDTKNSSMSFGASEAVWRYKSDPRRLKTLESWNDPEGSKAFDWRARNIIEEIIEEPPAAPIASSSSSKSSSAPALEELLLQPVPEGIDASLLRSSASQLEMEEQLRGELVKNAELVRKLQSYQWDRLRREYSRRRNQDLEIRDLLKALPRDKNGKVNERDALDIVKRIRKEQIKIQPGEGEQKIARELFDSLSKLIGSHDISYGESLVPSITHLRSLAASSAISSISGSGAPKGFWGTLPPISSLEDSKVPPSIVDNQTFRLTAQYEKTMNADAERDGEVIGTTKDMSVGLLERIANSREYDEKDDKHNLEPSKPIQRQQSQQRNRLPPPPPKQSHPQQLQRPMTNHRNTSPNKSSPATGFSPMLNQQQGVQGQQRFPPNPNHPAHRIGTPQGFRPNGFQSNPSTPNQQFNPPTHANPNFRTPNPAVPNNQMKFPNPSNVNVRPQMGQAQQQVQHQQQQQVNLGSNPNPNQFRPPQPNGYQQQMTPAANSSQQR